ncbi:hypothetical protein SAMN05421810_111156 [Amycolatopsis arida]|uniref:Uncharacterized protein n=1 Tax=Amycolatopsis arida TaxID=587909 RepID=A0A1I6A7T1_9PSEU|nr:DUF6410 domain-containing protein [Amycolatopsis arida]TDX88539.1 hypothetical protein CLV69_11157 [Amycolatopsis arida]SFQ64749.1 hypothetical protein SAMN05421810_111156 [Amycolatopsis arida]
MVQANPIGNPERAADRGDPVIGRHAGPVGRVFRVITGLVGFLPVFIILRGLSTTEVVVGLVWFVVVAAVVVAALALMRPWLAGRESGGLTGFVGSAILLLPMAAYPMGLLPEAPTIGLRLYTDFSVTLSGLIGYGGLEMAALPSLVLGHRPVLYSQYNMVDLVERRTLTSGRSPLAVLAGVLGVLGFAWFWTMQFWFTTVPEFVTGSPDARVPEVPAAVAPFAAAAIVLAGLLLLLIDRRAAAGRRWWWPLGAVVVVFGIGAPVGAMPDALYAVIILAGAVIGVRRLLARRRPAA